jgi:DNA repair exonuclease SbcCD ATPase subunit
VNEEKGIIRTIEEITASARLNMADMVNRAIALGQDLIDAKELLGHGKFLPWLNQFGISSSTASNYMRVAREITPGSRLASLPYSKALALLAAPPEEREQLAEEAEDKSAAEIRRLIAERDKAAEAANAETHRADQAEAETQRLTEELKNAENRVGQLKMQITNTLKAADQNVNLYAKKAQELREENQKLRADILTAENNRVEVEVLPKDYQAREDALLQAAAEAEERAAAAEAQVEQMKAERGNEGGAYEKLHYSLHTFMLNCEVFAINPGQLMADREKVRSDLDYLQSWILAVTEGMDGAIQAEGTVSA